jgi:hypothetical protein
MKGRLLSLWIDLDAKLGARRACIGWPCCGAVWLMPTKIASRPNYLVGYTNRKSVEAKGILIRRSRAR